MGNDETVGRRKMRGEDAYREGTSERVAFKREGGKQEDEREIERRGQERRRKGCRERLNGGGGGSCSSDYIVHQATGRPASAPRIDV